MTVPEEETQELRIEAAGGARDGWHEGDAMVVGIGGLVLLNLLLDGLLYRPIDVVRVAELAILGRLVRCMLSLTP